MVGLREQIHRGRLHKLVAYRAQTGDVSGPRGGVAAYVGELFGARLGYAFGHALGKTCARRIHHQGVKMSQLGELACAVAADDLGPGAVGFKVSAQVAYR